MDRKDYGVTTFLLSNSLQILVTVVLTTSIVLSVILFLPLFAILHLLLLQNDSWMVGQISIKFYGNVHAC